MGKNTAAGNSWLNVVKKAFRSPTKPTKSSKRREEHEQEDDEKVIHARTVPHITLPS